MEVRIRHVEQVNSKRFCDVEVGAVEFVMDTLKMGGGVYFEGEYHPDMSFQYVLDETGAYCEIILDA